MHIDCQVTDGSSVNGTTIWDKVGENRYISDAFVINSSGPVTEVCEADAPTPQELKEQQQIDDENEVDPPWRTPRADDQAAVEAALAASHVVEESPTWTDVAETPDEQGFGIPDPVHEIGDTGDWVIWWVDVPIRSTGCGPYPTISCLSFIPLNQAINKGVLEFTDAIAGCGGGLISVQAGGQALETQLGPWSGYVPAPMAMAVPLGC